MGMSTFIVGFKPPDAKWKRMKAIWDACKAGKVDPPKEVHDFFEGDEPDDAGVEVDLSDALGVRECHPHPTADGYEVDLSKLDPTIKIVRFYNSW